MLADRSRTTSLEATPLAGYGGGEGNDRGAIQALDPAGRVDSGLRAWEVGGFLLSLFFERERRCCVGFLLRERRPGGDVPGNHHL
jgi:hypothetical protein